MLCVFTVEKKCNLHIIILLVYIVSFLLMKAFYIFLLFRSVQEQAVKKFPKNVESRTVHSLAYRAVGHK
jgi:flagellar basal body-associated protein FliL